MNDKKNVYYDGTCPMCNVFASKVNTSSKNQEFVLLDANKNNLPSNISKERVLKEIHVVSEDGQIYRNSDAIMKILETYPRWRFIARLGKLPVIRQLMWLSYKFIAANRHSIFGESSQIFWTKIVLILATLSGIVLSSRLWVGNRLFPTVPLVENLSMSQNIGVIVFAILLGSLFFALIFPRPKKFIFIFLIALAMLAIFDQMRWQPWVYQYFLMFFVISFYDFNYKKIIDKNTIYTLLCIFISSIYIWSGLQKTNLVFIYKIFPWIAEPLWGSMPPKLGLLFGMLVPAFEILIGIALLNKGFRKLGVIMAVSMSLFLLTVLGPLGHNWNSVVWPWDIAMALFAIILFWRKGPSFKDLLPIRKLLILKIIVLLVIFMPIMSFFNLFDSYLSWTLYSGNTNSAQIIISDSVKEKLREIELKHTFVIGPEKNRLDYFMWSFDELNVPTYPESRIYKGITKKLCHTYEENAYGISLIINGKPTLVNRGEREVYTCASLD